MCGPQRDDERRRARRSRRWDARSRGRLVDGEGHGGRCARPCRARVRREAVTHRDCAVADAPSRLLDRRQCRRGGCWSPTASAPTEAHACVETVVPTCRPSRRRARSSTRCPRGCATSCPRRPRRGAALARSVLDRFALHGYALVTLPAFEFAEVLERGLGHARSGRRAALRRARVGRGRGAAAGHDAADRAHDRHAPARSAAARSGSPTRGPSCAGAAGARASTGRSRRWASSSPA